jgi:glycosyltransferase involved in cell wall biosynthesis
LRRARPPVADGIAASQRRSRRSGPRSTAGKVRSQIHSMITVSVIIPTYNSAALVPGAAKSVLSQTLQDFELIIVDDGSTDKTKDVIAPLLVDPRIHYLYQENKGLPGARNAGAIASSGRYLAFLDADDFLAEDALEVLVKRFDASGAAWANVSYLRLEGSTRTLSKAEWPPGDAFLAILEDDFITRCPFFRRSEFFDLGMYDEKMRMREDWDINIRLIASGKPRICIEEPLYFYTQTEGRITIGNRRRVLLYTEKLLQENPPNDHLIGAFMTLLQITRCC